jgi:ribosome-associated protein
VVTYPSHSRTATTAKLTLMPEISHPRPPQEGAVVVSRALTIPAGELLWRYSASGGPGGQHANTANTKAEVVWDIEASDAVSEPQRVRLIGKLGPVLRIAVTDERSQLRNRSIAEQRLKERVLNALVVERPRRATKPTKGATERRLKSKSEHSERKADRRSLGRQHDD